MAITCPHAHGFRPYIGFVEYKKKDLSRYTLIEGFPGMGLVGTIAAKYLIDRLGLQEYGYIDSNVFVPIIRIHKGIPVNPSRIYIDEKHKLLVLLAEQVIPRVYVSSMAKAVVEWIKEKKIRTVISLSGIQAEIEGAKKDTVYGIASNKEDIKHLKKHNLEVIEDGITTGMTALTMLELGNEKIEAFSIMGNVKVAADYEAAVAIIKKLNLMLNLNIKVEPLLKEAKETEAELIKHLEKLQKTTDGTQKFEEKAPMMYT